MEESAGNETSLTRRRRRKAPVRFGFEDDEDEEEEETKDPFDDDGDFDDKDWNRREDLDSDCAGEDEETDNEEEEEESSDEEDEGENTKQQAEEGRKNHRAFATSDVKRKSGAQAWSNFRTKRYFAVNCYVFLSLAFYERIFSPQSSAKVGYCGKGSTPSALPAREEDSTRTRTSGAELSKDFFLVF